MAEYIGQNLYITPTMITSVPEYDTPKFLFSLARVRNHENLKFNKHKNKLSDKAQKRIKTAINWLVASAKEKKVYSNATKSWFTFKVNLITMTLPDTFEEIKEKEFKEKLMHPFLVYMKKYKGLNNYVWKLEFQKNGKLHVHLTTDSFINHSELRFYWNALLKKNGYLDKFMKDHKHDNPNSTDVHSVWKVKNLGAYIAKYLAKNEDSEGVINGRIWGCNYELSAKNKCVLHVPANELKEVLTELFNPIIDYKEILTQDSLSKKVYRQAELFFLKLHDWGTLIKGDIYKAYNEHRFRIRNNIPKLDLVYTV